MDTGFLWKGGVSHGGDVDGHGPCWGALFFVLWLTITLWSSFLWVQEIGREKNV